MHENIGIDRISFDILRKLANDARISNKELAAHVELAPSSVHERLKRLRGSGAYRGAHADVNFEALGFALQALIHVGLTKHKRNAVDSFMGKLRGIEEVRQVFLITGRFDLIVQVVIRDMEHLKNVAYEFTTQATVERIETSVVFQAWKQYELPEPAWDEKGAKRSAAARRRGPTRG